MTAASALEAGVTLVVISSFWMMVVLAVRKPVARWIGARFAYRLWLIPLVAMLAFAISGTLDLKGGPGFELPVIGLIIDGTLDALARVEPFTAAGATKPSPASAATAALLVLWALGSALSFAMFVFESWRFASALARTSEPLDDAQWAMLERDMASVAGFRTSTLKWRISPYAPAVAGLFRPVVLLPPDFFENFTSAQRSLVLRHELHHLRRRDLAWLCVARLHRALFWFNPLAYLAERCLQLDQELSCDEQVLARSDLPTRRLYGETLLTALHVRPRVAHAPYLPTFRQLKERTTMLKHYHHRKSTTFMGTVLVVAALAAGAVYGAAAPASKAEAALSRGVYEMLSGIQAQISAQRAQDPADVEAFVMLLAHLEAQAAKFPEGSLSDYELAQITNLAGYLAFLMKDFRLAIAHYRPILDLAHEYPAFQAATLKTIAQLHFSLQDFDAALSYVNRAITLADSENAPEDLLRLKRAIDLELGNSGR